MNLMKTLQLHAVLLAVRPNVRAARRTKELMVDPTGLRARAAVRPANARRLEIHTEPEELSAFTPVIRTVS